MRLLLDTHALLWLLAGDRRLSARVADLYRERANEVYVSAVSLWEIGIKLSLGKLQLAANWSAVIEREMTANGVRPLPVELSHCAALQQLPFHHRDPFDRMLLTQAFTENLAIVSCDRGFSAYDVELIW